MNVDSLLAISPVIPVVTIEDARHAVPLAKAMQAGGLGIVEVTLRSHAALHAIERITAEVPGLSVLAGTVCRSAQVTDSLNAGAAGLVSPGLTGHLADAVLAHRAAWLPGVATASEIMRGLELGLRRFKFFPAEAAGGREALLSFAAPFPDVRFCPTGGISVETAPGYLELANVECVGGSWVAPSLLVDAGDWPAIQANARLASGLRRGSS